MSASFVNSISNTLGSVAPSNPPPHPKMQQSFWHEDKDYNSWEDYLSRTDPYKPYGGSGYVGSPSSSYKPLKGYTPPPTKKVAVILKDGSAETYTVPVDSEGWFAIARHVWPTEGLIMQVPIDHCSFEYREPTFNACVYTATNDYMQARWGRKLDDSDRRWLAAHPYTTNAGVPQEYTATCVDQLVTPYGMRVSRVRLRKGSLVLGDSIMGWIHALGCNPFAMVDRSTSNAEAAERIGIPIEQANALWRVEFADDPLSCSVIGERGWVSGNGVSTGAMGGHARYLAPRARAGDWFISVQLDVDTAVQHLVDPPNPEYVPRKGDRTLTLSSITDPQGQQIASRQGTTWKPVAAAVSAVLPAEPPPPAVTTKTFSPTSPPCTCLSCGSEEVPQYYLMQSADVCLDCLDEAWRGITCPHCNEHMDRWTPDPVAFDSTTYDWQCAACKGTITVPVDCDARDPLSDLSELSALIFLSGETEYVTDSPDATGQHPDDWV